MGCFSSKSNATPVSSKPAPKNPRDLDTQSTAEHRPPQSLELKAGQFVQLLKEPIYRQYTYVKQLGSGSFGKVYLAEHKVTHQRRAIKELDKTQMDTRVATQSKFISEVEILSKLDHPSILKVYDLFEDPLRFYMVTEACEGGELFDYIVNSQRLTEQMAAHVMHQLFSAICFCHKQGIVHRDLKPENLLIDSISKSGEINIKVIDFGTSTLMNKDQKLRQRLGTPYYIAPEVLAMDYNEKCDIWSCGVILFILLSGQPPFNGQNDVQIMNAIRLGKYTFFPEFWRHVSEEAKSFIQKLLEMDYNRRISAAECLKDPWIQKYHAKTLSNEPPAHALNNLKEFATGSRLRQAFMSFIVAQLLTKEQTEQVRKEFLALDTDGDGRLSREELIAGYCRSMPEEKAMEIANHIMNIVDVDGNGFIEYSEFLAAATSHETLLSKNNLEMAFNACDTDGSGSISIPELKAMLGAGNAANEQVWTRLIEGADQNGDGEIDLKEFTNLMLKAQDL